jgi:hypothetical protein
MDLVAGRPTPTQPTMGHNAQLWGRGLDGGGGASIVELPILIFTTLPLRRCCWCVCMASGQVSHGAAAVASAVVRCFVRFFMSGVREDVGGCRCWCWSLCSLPFRQRILVRDDCDRRRLPRSEIAPWNFVIWF